MSDNLSNSRLIICVKKNINGEELDNGHFGLICAHCVGIAFNCWSCIENRDDILFKQYPNIIFNEKYTQHKFNMWRWHSFRKLILQIDSDKDFENIRNKLIRDEIPFRVCGEMKFNNAEVAMVIFPLEKHETPKYLKFMKMWH